MKLSTPQRLMRDDGLPAKLFLTDEQRAKAWAGRTLTVVPFIATAKTRDESPETAAFRAQVEEQRRLKSLAGITRMKTRFASKAIDYTKMCWDARRAKFVPVEPGTTKPAPVVKAPRRDSAVPPKVEITPIGAATLSKDNAEAVARLNGVWKDSYEKLRGTGRIVMTVSNVLKGLVKRGGTVKWQ